MPTRKDYSPTQNLSLTTANQIERVIAAIAQHAPYQLPLFRAARDGLINLIQPTRTAVIQKRRLEDRRRPIIVLLGDDDYSSTGPEGWHAARRLRYWSQGGMVHGAGGEASHYLRAVELALMFGKFVLVETNSAYMDAWGLFLAPHMPLLGVRAQEKFPHPKPLTRPDLH